MNEKVIKVINEADAIVIGAGSGLSTAAGLTYSGKRFEDNFGEFIEKYKLTDMYSSGFYPFKTQEERWAYWCKHIYHNRYEHGPKDLYLKLYDLFKNREYFVLTTNVDHQFYLAGFDEDRIFATQGDYGLFQCSKACHPKTYSNEEIVVAMLEAREGCRIPSELVPKCPVCGEPMDMNLRKDDLFVEDETWHKAHERYQDFIIKNQHKKILFLELGVGGNTPVIIKYPFWRMTHQLPHATYVCVNQGQAVAPKEIADQSICIDGDIAEVFGI